MRTLGVAEPRPGTGPHLDALLGQAEQARLAGDYRTGSDLAGRAAALC
jgi:hypothetical protein